MFLGTRSHPSLQARIEQAQAGGCPEGLVSEAKRQLHRLLLAEVKAELDAGEWGSTAACKPFHPAAARGCCCRQAQGCAHAGASAVLRRSPTNRTWRPSLALCAVLKLSRGAEKSVAQRLSSLKVGPSLSLSNFAAWN